MIRYLKENHETGQLYFTDNSNCEICEMCGDSDYIIWSYNTNKPINDTLQSLFELILEDEENSEIRDIKDLKLIQKELNFGLDLLNEFNDLLTIKNKINDIKDEYESIKTTLQDMLNEM